MSAFHKISPNIKISIVLPVFNESAILRILYKAIIASLKKLNVDFEIVFVNDGSTDKSGDILDEIASEDQHVTVVHFSRNFGHQSALQAGLEYSTGDAVIIMDSDMQDNPDAITQFIEEWQKGYDIVYAIRTNRKEFFIKRILFNLFYRLLMRISDIKLPLNAGNFGLIDRKVYQHIASLPEKDRYFPGLRGWVGYKQKGIEIERNARYDKSTRVGLTGLFMLAKTAIISFSSFPVTIFLFLGSISFIVFLILSTIALYHKLVLQIATPGWTSFLIVTSFFGSLNALGIGILGEYVVRIYKEVRQRPLFLIERHVNTSRTKACSKTDEELQDTGNHKT